MTLELGSLVAASVAYLLVLFLVAYAAERGVIPSRITQHPLVYSLALGVYATSWSYFGSVGYAARHGFRYLGIYLGVTLACLLMPVLWRPLLRLTRELQLTSLADVLAFRYPGQTTGTAVTLFMLAGSLPYLALQVRAVVESAKVLSPSASPALVGLGFCAVLTIFSVLFGARHLTPRERHEGLMLAIAFESAVKAVALVAVGLWAVSSVFGGVDGFLAWLDTHPEAVDGLQRPARDASWAPLLVLSCMAAFLTPRSYHVAFTEAPERDALSTATWAFPLVLLVMNLCVPLVLWSGDAAGLPWPADFHVLAVPASRGATALALLAFIGGVSASSAMVIVTTLALAPMCLTHLVLPLGYARGQPDLYGWLLWARRLLIAIIILAGYGFYRLLDTRGTGLVDLGLVSFVAVAQFAPGVLGLLFWKRGTRAGLLAGLSVGAAMWAVTLVVPLWASPGVVAWTRRVAVLLGFPSDEPWGFSTFASLTLNVLAFVAVSLATRQSAREAEAARACTREGPGLASGEVAAGSPEEFRRSLAPLLGEEAASAEVDRALAALGLPPDERRPAELRRLRDGVERNLSGLLGPVLARMAVEEALRLEPGARTALAEQLRFVEERLRDARGMQGGAVHALEAVRSYLRRILEDLPLGVCAVGPDGEVVIWNAALERLSGVEVGTVRGHLLEALPEPWGVLLSGFAEGAEEDTETRVTVAGGERVLRLHRSRLSAAEERGTASEGMALLVEDLTERKAVDARLAHQDRLASLGRVAAGVAHEIGNPLTAIASLAQNLKYELDDAEAVRERVGLILQQCRRIDAIVRALVGFSHAGTVGGEARPFTRVAVGPLLTESVQLARLARGTRKDRGLRFEHRCPEGLEVLGDAQRLEQVLVNLLTNAIDASPDGAVVELEAEAGEGGVHLRVMDRGPGVPRELSQRIFEPFFTTKQPGEGTGLGLALVAGIVREHGGVMQVDSRPGGGTSVTVSLPEPRQMEQGVRTGRGALA
ncbi:PAS domain-containing protein [Pyxidicoccus parkwayensis]|uniref:histidine kinase n=1 Tax=Pyxidicoccus parkwayensis TaxID=2813578 RepID=A0ABX7NXS5_9BACT|nr:ATP-binding protein [Pyxidicoccus parkwaysis]QSQ23726.1 PAS domain-containing protein [Pyxidicoccus parkwaysis]